MTRANWPSHEQAYRDYLALGDTRSLAKLSASYVGKYDPVPVVSTLKQWSVKENWAARAKEHDIQSASLTMTLATEATAEGHLDMAREMHTVAFALMNKALRMASKAKDGHVGDANIVADIGIRISKHALDAERGKPPSAERLAELMKSIGKDPTETVVPGPGAGQPDDQAKPSILKQFDVLMGGKGDKPN